jgi:type VI secretion system protein ImpE
MMKARELLDAGRLAEAIQDLNQWLKVRPMDGGARVSLFEALCFTGEYERAARQLDVLRTRAADPAGELALEVYRHLLTAEKNRQQVFAGTALPKFLRTPPPSVEQYVVLLAKTARGDTEVGEAYATAEDETPARPGRIGETRFSHFRDADDRVAPVLEAFHGADYLWLPFEQIRRIEIASPKYLRDLVWIPAVIELVGEAPGDLFIPVLYVNSSAAPNDQVKLGRMTEWQAIGERLVTGVGQRVFIVDEDERAILDLRRIDFDPSGEKVATA